MPNRSERLADRRRELEEGGAGWRGLVFGGIGLVLGASVDDSLWGALSGLALGVLIAGWLTARRRADTLVEVVSRLEQSLRTLERPAGPADEPEARAPGDTAKPKVPVQAPPEGAQPVAPAIERPLPARPEAGPGPFESGLRLLRDFLLGGNTVVRVGVLVLLVGVSLLAKWAADHAFFPIEARLASAALIGVVLTGLGYRLREVRPGFGTTLQGGGIAALYLVVFFAFRLYGLLPAGLAFALFAAVSGAGGTLAVLQRSQPLIFIASLGGFMAPILASTDSGNHVALFGYYLVLNIGIAAVAWLRAWRPLNLLAFVCTYGVATAWGVLRYQPEHFATTEPFVLAFLVLFTGEALIFAWRRPPRLRGVVDGTLIFGTPLVTLLAQARLVAEMDFGLAYSAAGLGLYYAALATWLWRTAPATLRRLCEAFIALAVGFGTMAIPFAFDEAMTTAVAWALEGAGLYWVGVRQQHRLARLSGIGLQLLAAIAFSVALDDPAYQSGSREFIAIANGRFLSCLALALAGLFIAREAHAVRARLTRQEWLASQVLAPWGLLWWAGGGSAEIDQFVPSAYRAASLVTLVGVSGLGLERAAQALGWLHGRLLALAALPAAFLAILPALDQQPHLLAHGGVLAWPFCLAAIYALLRRVETDAPEWLLRAYAPALWLVALVTGIALAGFADHGLGLAGDWPQGTFGLALGGVLLGALFAVERGLGAFGRHTSLQLREGMGPVVGVALLWALWINLTARGEADPLPYLPILNPVDAALCLLAVVVLSWWTCLLRRHPERVSDEWRQWLAPALGGFGFVWLNGLLVRSVHQWSGVPFHADALWDSVALQVALSIAWTLLALAGMVLSTRQGWRRPWLAFATLLGAVVVKLFTVDLSQLSTEAKIVTFLVVGVLLVVVGYLSPVPPSQDRDERDEAPPLAQAQPGDPS